MEENLKKKLDEELKAYDSDIEVLRKRTTVIKTNQALFDEKKHKSIGESKRKSEIEDSIKKVDPESAFEDEEREELNKKAEEHQDETEKTDWSIKVANRAIKNEQEAVELKLEGMRNQLLKQYEEKQANLKEKVANLKTGKDIEEKRKEALARIENLSNEEFETSKEDTIARLNAHFDVMRSEQEAEFEASQEDLKKENKDNLAILKILRDKERFDGYVLNEYEFKAPEQDNLNGKFRTGKPTKEEQEFLDEMDKYRKEKRERLQKEHEEYEEDKAKDFGGTGESGRDNSGTGSSNGKFRTGKLTAEEQEFLNAMDEHRKQKIANLQKEHEEYEEDKAKGFGGTGKPGKDNSKNELKHINIGVKGIEIVYLDKDGKPQVGEYKLSDIKKYMKENKDLSSDPFVEFAIDKYRERIGEGADKEIAEFSEKYYNTLLDDLSIAEPGMKDMVTYNRTNLDYLKPKNVLKFISNRKIYREMRDCAFYAESAELATIVPDKKGKIRGVFSNIKNRLAGAKEPERLTDGSDENVKSSKSFKDEIHDEKAAEAVVEVGQNAAKKDEVAKTADEIHKNVEATIEQEDNETIIE